RVAIERAAGLLTVAVDELARTPFVARMDDPAVAGRGPEAERVRLEQGHRAAGPGELAGGVDARIAAADDDDVGGVRQRATRSVGQGRHRRTPQRAALEVGVHRVAWHRRIVA